ncbi:hypothetical protein EV426DRAFT_706744 [Tirmania nivea]|nr:hypothetical protein EV426DRAFT_706744 [Tirmania nivea]
MGAWGIGRFGAREYPTVRGPPKIREYYSDGGYHKREDCQKLKSAIGRGEEMLENGDIRICYITIYEELGNVVTKRNEARPADVMVKGKFLKTGGAGEPKVVKDHWQEVHVDDNEEEMEGHRE